MCDGGSGELLVVEIDGVCETFAVGGFYVAYMCVVVLALVSFCIHLVLLSSGLLTLNCPVYVFLESFMLVSVLTSLLCMPA